MAFDGNLVVLKEASVGGTPSIEAVGDDTDINMILKPKGSTGVVYLNAGQELWVRNEAGDYTAFEVLTYAALQGDAIVNYLRVGPALTGNAPYIAAIGTDTNIDLNLITSGTGRVQENGVGVVIGGTGSTDNALIRADGTGGKTVQGGTDMPTVDDSGNITMTKKVIFGSTGSLTISGGEITVTQTIHSVLTEAAAGTDDLDTINGGTAGQFLILRAGNSTRTVVCKDGTGNLALAGDFSLTHADDTITMYYDGGTNQWHELSRSDNGT